MEVILDKQKYIFFFCIYTQLRKQGNVTLISRSTKHYLKLGQYAEKLKGTLMQI